MTESKMNHRIFLNHITEPVSAKNDSAGSEIKVICILATDIN